jgi:hypothetical protein
VETGGGADQLRVTLQLSTASELGVLQLLDRLEMAIDQAAVGQWPEVLGRLELRRVRREKQQVHMVGHAQFDAGVPAGAVEHQHDLLGGTGSHCSREGGQLDFKERDADAGGQVKDGPPRGGVHEADQIAPGIPMADQGNGALADRGPDPAQQRFEADPMLIDGPQFDLRLREGRRDRPQERTDLFLNVSCCSAAASACRGRGTCRLCLARTR